MKIYNTLTNSLEEFKPISDDLVKIYVCGPTVYNYIHIGNTRPIVVFDTLARFLMHKGYKLKFVQNFTDIDDKIIKKANEMNISIEEVTKKYINAFIEDTNNLNLIKDVIRPKVTENLSEIIEMIQKLIDNGYAYKKENDILFSIDKFKNYGKLSNQKLDELNKGVRIDLTDKENEKDFVLWKGKKENEPYYDSPFSKGRPGWHIECSAMINRYLGENIDIHAGGQDLIFPHHENEIAQSVCSTNEKSFFVKYWMHNAYITLNNEKMSKSTGNFLLLHDVLKEFSGEVVRYFILTSHYRKAQNFSKEELIIAKKTVFNIKKQIAKFNNETENNSSLVEEVIKDFETEFNKALEDDLNTPKALASISKAIKSGNKLLSENEKINLRPLGQRLVYYIENVLGVKLDKEIEMNNNEILNILLEVRQKLRDEKNYNLSDYIRDRLKEIDIDINDKK
ncbi:cysteine--tRNA ligase [Oceanivirga miroungae]|uniref:Cysteine--tRNA ligase n=1 Tax=Oceanivirga miroungae TaxID=1130046 RepID=A0A6I8MB88_9FUSO|nr:cysteine--tRNA ligase [Oceanivirga miroungae]VWL85495.1 cysteinyl-tRNA synthetase [Oceanivirga miroungae]